MKHFVSFDVSALFTSIPVPGALEVINWKFTEHINQNRNGKLVLNNCVFPFQGNFYKQLQGAARGLPASPLTANIYMEKI